MRFVQQPYHFFTLEFHEQLGDFLRVNAEGKIFNLPFQPILQHSSLLQECVFALKVCSQYILQGYFQKSMDGMTS